jgi:hypothetical protein
MCASVYHDNILDSLVSKWQLAKHFRSKEPITSAPPPIEPSASVHVRVSSSRGTSTCQSGLRCQPTNSNGRRRGSSSSDDTFHPVATRQGTSVVDGYTAYPLAIDSIWLGFFNGQSRLVRICWPAAAARTTLGSTTTTTRQFLGYRKGRCNDCPTSPDQKRPK